MACLDTTFWIDFMRSPNNQKHRAADQALRLLRQSGQPITTTRFNVAELLAGVEFEADAITARQKLDAAMSNVAILDFDEAACERFAKIDRYLRQRGLRIGDMDMLIASTAYVNNEAVYTRNVAHFRLVPGLQVVEY